MTTCKPIMNIDIIDDCIALYSVLYSTVYTGIDDTETEWLHMYYVINKSSVIYAILFIKHSYI